MPDNRLKLKDAETQLSSRMLDVVKYVFEHPTLTQREYAAHFGFSEGRISTILHHPKVLDAYPILARAKIKGMVPKAIKRFNELMEQNNNLVVSEKVTTRVLDSQKVLAPVEIKHTHELGNATIEELHRIVNQSQQILEPVIDGELVDPVRPILGESLGE